ncbi:kinesin light chain [Ceratobasidium sp. AG-Ba]|nr:kinesin light chain [Ceratobasidium sp. AG-Ba]
MPKDKEKGLNILIFEGGVAGGLSSLVFLKELTHRVHAKGGSSSIYEQYDVIAGTGTGALNACMLGLLGLDIGQAIQAYARLVGLAFSEKKYLSPGGAGVYKANKLEAELRQIVKDATGEEDTCMIDSRKTSSNYCKVMAFAMSKHNMTALIPRIFRSYEGMHSQMPNRPIWEVVRASMAHPELFDSFLISDGPIRESLVGGDIGCSNPTPHVLAEVSMLYPDRRVSSIICIGAGHARTIQMPESNLIQRVMPSNVLAAMKQVATDSERVAEDMAERFEDTPKVYFRFNVDQGLQKIQTAEWQRMGEVVAHTRAYMSKSEVTRQMKKAVEAIVGRKAIIRASHIGGKAQKSLAQLSSMRQPLEQILPAQIVEFKRCPAPSPAFTGREHQISQISECLIGPPNERRVSVVHGIGGSGKTQIALKVVERTQNKWSDIIYLDASSEKTLESALKDFALVKQIGNTHIHATQWLETSIAPWLMIFDNANDPKLCLTGYIPRGLHGSILITTRLRCLALLSQGPGSDFTIGSMEANEAVDLLIKQARREKKDLTKKEQEAAAMLVEDVGCLPLAIVHAAAYMWCSQISITKYRDQCREHMQDALERYSNLPASPGQYEKTVYTTWTADYKRLSSRSQQLLWLLAFMSKENIKEETFQRATTHIDRELIIPIGAEDEASWQYIRSYLQLFVKDEKWNSIVFSTTMDELLSYSLVDYDRVHDAYTLHVLVQDWVRSNSLMPHSTMQAQKHTSHLLALSVDWPPDPGAIAYCIDMISHVNQVLDNLVALDPNDAMWFALAYEQNGLWQKEEELWDQVIEAERTLLGDNHPHTLASLGNLAATYFNQRRFDQAEKLQLKILNALRKCPTEDRSNVLVHINNLASTYRRNGQWAMAENLQVWVMNEMKQTHGMQHSSTLMCMQNLSSLYSKLHQFDKAEALEQQILDARKAQFGERHADTLSAMSRLAEIYFCQGRSNEAEELQARVVAGSKLLLGSKHRRTVRAQSRLVAIQKPHEQPHNGGLIAGAEAAL